MILRLSLKFGDAGLLSRDRLLLRLSRRGDRLLSCLFLLLDLLLRLESELELLCLESDLILSLLLEEEELLSLRCLFLLESFLFLDSLVALTYLAGGDSDRFLDLSGDFDLDLLLLELFLCSVCSSESESSIILYLLSAVSVSEVDGLSTVSGGAAIVEGFSETGGS